MIRRVWAAAGGAVAAGLASALCCAGPLVAVVLGVSGAGLASTFEPLRPYFIGATVLALGAGHWSLRREAAGLALSSSLSSGRRSLAMTPLVRLGIVAAALLDRLTGYRATLVVSPRADRVRRSSD